MKISFNRVPMDILFFMFCTIILLIIVMLNVDGYIRIIIGLPFIFFIPGYILIFALFPKRKEKSIDILERIALSIGLSIAIVPLIGLALNYTSWGIRLESMFFVISIFIFGVGSIAFLRWLRTLPDERYCITIDLSLIQSKNKFNVLTIILLLCITISLILLLYVITNPKVGERFTEFYLLGNGGKADEYVQNLSVGENAYVFIGISNHEYRIINYSVDIWLVNQSTYYNASKSENVTSIDHMWFIDGMTIQLDSIPLKIDEPWTPQWEHNYSFFINRTGNFKLVFLLSKIPTESYFYELDYKDSAEDLLNSAYREVYLWITVTSKV
jgi:uncharacterized membrane protein